MAMEANRRAVVWGVVWLLLLPGCDVRAPDPPIVERPAVVEEAVEVEEPEARPEEKVVETAIEGMPAELRLVLYESPADYPLPFSTYLPEDMVAVRDRTGEVDEVVMLAVFGGVRNEAAAVRVMVHRAGASQWEVEEVLRQVARDLGTELEASPDPARYDWSIREYRNVARRYPHEAAEGRMAVGRREGRYFTLAVHYPAEYGDGFEPRAGHILGEWRWESNGEGLLD
jgi:hypothetical protein